MKKLLQIALFISISSLNAKAATYFINDNEAKVLNLPSIQTEFQLEFKRFKKQTESEPWIKTHEEALCFGEKNGCYTAIARHLTHIVLPDTNSEESEITQYTYGLRFENPVAEKTAVTGENWITKQIGNDGKTEIVIPRLINVKNIIDVGTWSIIEFAEQSNSYCRIEVRIIKSAKNK